MLDVACTGLVSSCLTSSHQCMLHMQVDTGSGLIDMPCSTPNSRARNCPSPKGLYVLNDYNLIDRNTCGVAALSTNGTECFVPSPSEEQGSCYWAQQVIMGTGWRQNIPLGLSSIIFRFLIRFFFNLPAAHRWEWILDVQRSVRSGHHHTPRHCWLHASLPPQWHIWLL